MKALVRSALSCLVLGLCLLYAWNFVAATSAKDSPTFLYTCKCGKKCDCNAVATSPGNCPCGKKLKENYILQLQGDQAIVCDCGGGCECSLKDNDPELCSCGMPVREVSLKGLYACACGQECSCNTVSDQPGTCACGKELRKVE